MTVGYTENLRMRDYLFDWIIEDIEKACVANDGWGPVFTSPTDKTTAIVKILLQLEGSRNGVLWSPRQEAEWRIPELTRSLCRHARILGMFSEQEVAA